MPWDSILARSSGLASEAAADLCRRLTTGAGVPAGAKIPNQKVDSNCGKPASSEPGMPGIAGEPLRIATTSGLRRPALMKPMTVGEVANRRCVSPASTDCAAGPPPLYCTVVNLTPAAASKAARAGCGVEP